MKKLNHKYVVIIIVVLLLIVGVCLVFVNKGKFNVIGKDVLYNVYPNGNKIVELEVGTYYKEKQSNYCKIKLPGNYSGWSMFLNSDDKNITFEMANSSELFYSIENGLLEQEEVVQQFYYSDKHLGKEKITEVFGNVFTDDQIKYENMKEQTVNAVEIKDNAFYSEGDKKYTDIDITLYYRVNDNITLQLSYKGPLVEDIGVDAVAKQLYKCIEVIG